MTNGTATANTTAYAVIKGLRDATTEKANEAYKNFQQTTNQKASVEERKEAVAEWAYWESKEEAYNKILADIEKRMENAPKI